MTIPTRSVRVRSAPRKGTLDAVRALNAQWKARGVRSRVSEDVDATIAQASAARKAGITQLRTWAFHPDERVCIALMENPHRPWEGANEWFLACALLGRAEQINRVESLTWNPVLDRICSGFRAEAAQVRRWNEAGEMVIEARDTWSYAHERRREIERHLETEDDEEVALALLDFRHAGFGDAIKHARHLSESWVTASRTNPDLASSALKNPRLHGAEARRILDAAVEDLRSGEGRDKSWLSGQIVVTYDEEHGVPGDVLAQMLREMEEEQPGKQRTGAANRIAVTIALMHTAPSEALERVYRLKGDEHQVVTYIVQHPNASLPLLRAIARERTDFRVRSRLAERTEAIQDPEIADALAKSSSAEIRQAFIRRGVGHHFRENLKRALNDHPGLGGVRRSSVLHWVVTRFDEVALDLTPELVDQLEEVLVRERYRQAIGHGFGDPLGNPDLMLRYWQRRIETAFASSPEAYAEEMGEMAIVRPEMAVAEIEAAPIARLSALPASLLTRFLGHEDGTLREATIRAIGRRTEAASACMDAEHRPQPRGR